jgi:hypothetical protein
LGVAFLLNRQAEGLVKQGEKVLNSRRGVKQMSVFYGVRLPDELSAKIEATGQGKTEVIVSALEAYLYFGGKVERPKVEKMIISKPAKVEIQKVQESEPEKPREIERPAPAILQRFSGCPECGSVGGMHQRKCSKR